MESPVFALIILTALILVELKGGGRKWRKHSQKC